MVIGGYSTGPGPEIHSLEGVAKLGVSDGNRAGHIEPGIAGKKWRIHDPSDYALRVAASWTLRRNDNPRSTEIQTDWNNLHRYVGRARAGNAGVCSHHRELNPV